MVVGAGREFGQEEGGGDDAAWQKEMELRRIAQWLSTNQDALSDHKKNNSQSHGIDNAPLIAREGAKQQVGKTKTRQQRQQPQQQQQLAAFKLNQVEDALDELVSV